MRRGRRGWSQSSKVSPPPAAASAQGELMRTIMRSTDRVTAGNREAFFFIMGLLVFAVASSCYVMYNGASAWAGAAGQVLRRQVSH